MNEKVSFKNVWHCNAARPAPQDSQEALRRQRTVPKNLGAGTG